MALHHGMGVRVEASEAGRDAGIHRLYVEPYLVAGSWSEGGSVSEGGRGGYADADGGRVVVFIIDVKNK